MGFDLSTMIFSGKKTTIISSKRIAGENKKNGFSYIQGQPLNLRCFRGNKEKSTNKKKRKKYLGKIVKKEQRKKQN